ncbi:MAG TPA: DUF1223 domain-containing protein [Burkholderiaceae bacterium]|nr:DUF1223 domain-containing protein [Burkholderiaceae bacterium]
MSKTRFRYDFRLCIHICALSIGLSTSIGAWAAANSCSAQSPPNITTVIELYTSEGCSSCPPADQWLSGLKTVLDPKTPNLVVQAFHVGYWNYIGWVDRFADPAHTQRQRQIATWNRQNTIYTPQLTYNSKDWRDWRVYTGASLLNQVAKSASQELASSRISLQQLSKDQFVATVAPVVGVAGKANAWSAYWTVTEHGHASKVSAGENTGEHLLHDFVVRQYTPVGTYSAGATHKLSFFSKPATPGHARQINLVLFDPSTGSTVQALSVNCGA